jgi:Mce-associated membrane protein
VSDDAAKTEEQEHDEETASDVEPTDEVEQADEVETDKDVDAADADAAKEPAGVPWRQLVSAIPVIPVVLVLALLAAGGLTAWLYFFQFRPDQRTDAAVGQSAVDAARDGTVALLSYKPDTLSQDFANAKSHLTGDFLNYYEEFSTKVLTPAAKDRQVTTTAQVVGAAPKEVHANSAVVMVFVDQASTSKERPDPSMDSSTVLVSLTKVHGAWLISKFDPI